MEIYFYKSDNYGWILLKSDNLKFRKKLVYYLYFKIYFSKSGNLKFLKRIVSHGSYFSKGDNLRFLKIYFSKSDNLKFLKRLVLISIVGSRRLDSTGE